MLYALLFFGAASVFAGSRCPCPGHYQMHTEAEHRPVNNWGEAGVHEVREELERRKSAAEAALKDTLQRLSNCEGGMGTDAPFPYECQKEKALLEETVGILDRQLDQLSREDAAREGLSRPQGGAPAASPPDASRSFRNDRENLINFSDTNFSRAKRMAQACWSNDLDAQKRLKAQWWSLPADSEGDLRALLKERDAACYKTFRDLRGK